MVIGEPFNLANIQTIKSQVDIKGFNDWHDARHSLQGRGPVKQIEFSLTVQHGGLEDGEGHRVAVGVQGPDLLPGALVHHRDARANAQPQLQRVGHVEAKGGDLGVGGGEVEDDGVDRVGLGVAGAEAAFAAVRERGAF